MLFRGYWTASHLLAAAAVFVTLYQYEKSRAEFWRSAVVGVMAPILVPIEFFAYGMVEIGLLPQERSKGIYWAGPIS